MRRSVTQSTGESDLELTVELEAGAVGRLLIENKIDAGFQADQAVRYRRRAETYLERQECALCSTVLVAPSRYLGSGAGNKGFDAWLAYEDILAWFRESDLGHRLAYKAALLSAAIEKSTLGYQPVADAPVTDFWREYWKAALALAPRVGDVRALNQAGTGRASPTFDHPPCREALRSATNFLTATLTSNSGGGAIGCRGFGRIVAPHLAEGMKLVKAAKSASVRLQTRSLNTGQPFAAQEPEAVAGIRAARASARLVRAAPGGT